MQGSDMMKIPQRRRGYDSEEETVDGDEQMPGVPSLDAVSANFDLLQTNNAMALNISTSDQNTGGDVTFKPVRRPSREADDFFDELEEMRVSSDQSELDSNPDSMEFGARIYNNKR
jgi:hypothetical protein